jgi:two-component system sensor histidine kinase AtoS
VIVLLLGAFGIWLFARTITGPIRHLAGAAGKIAAGDLDQTIPVGSSDEIGHLASSFAYMTGKLRENMNSLRGANEALRKNVAAIEGLRTYIENILNSIAAGIITVDLSRKLTYVNNAGKRLLGLSGTSCVGRSLEELFGSSHFLRASLARIAGRGSQERQGEPHATDVVFEGRTLSITTDLLFDQNHDIVGYLAVFEEVTELRELQKRVQHEEKMGLMGRLAAGIAHEVRNPLGAMKTCAQFLERGTDPSDRRYHFIELIIRESKRVEGLVSRLLNYARPGESDVEYSDLNAAVDTAVELAALKAHQNRVSIGKDFTADLPRLYIDVKRISQAVLNLLLNSLESVDDRGRITVATRWSAETESATIVIADNGKGIPSGDLERIFDPFFTTRPGGTGLGLAIVQQIVFEHHGTIRVESREGRGTQFTITLPHCHERRPEALAGALT